MYHFYLFLRYRHLFHCKFHSLDAEEALSRFQAGELNESYQEWHLLVTPEACDALGKVEVQRQSVIFEIIKSERDYVADLEAVEQVGVTYPSCPIPSRLNSNFKVFIDQLQLATPPIMSVPNLNNFIHRVFGNIHEILVHHKQILAALYVRQREQHPLILTIADIFLDGKPLTTFCSSVSLLILSSHSERRISRRVRNLYQKLPFGGITPSKNAQTMSPLREFHAIHYSRPTYTKTRSYNVSFASSHTNTQIEPSTRTNFETHQWRG